MSVKPILYHIQYNAGQSILEVIVAMAVFALIGAALVTMVVGSFEGLKQGGEQTQAEALAQEGIEAIRSIRDRAWNENLYAQSAVEVSGNQWIFSGEGTTETIGQFVRSITFADVCRDGADNIATCPGLYVDVHSKEVKVEITWQRRPGVTNSVQRIAYVTNWDSREWTQTNWFGGAGQSIWADSTRYDSDSGEIDVGVPGEVKLATLVDSGETLDPAFDFTGGSSFTSWLFDVAGNYIYNSGKIEVIGSNAQLIESDGSIVSGDTLNATFDTDASNWAYADWDEGGGDPDAIGTHRLSGGNPNGYVEITLPFNLKGKRLGGFWEQPFTTTLADPTVSCEVDWSSLTVTLPLQGVDELFVAVYLDSVSGEPTIGTEVLKKDFTDIFSWESHSGLNAFDCSSSVSVVGTYYYKIAVWIDGTNKNTGPIAVGFDNARVHWEKVTGGSFPTDKPHITPVNSFSSPGLQSWDSFEETAIKSGTSEIFYQLSIDAGASWQYWSGVAWINDPDGDEGTDENDYNTALVVHTNIGSLTTNSEQVLFRAFLVSDGTDQIQLNEITIGFSSTPSPWSFAPWDVRGGEVTPAGTLNSSGGNPGSYAQIRIPSNARRDEVGGYWEQPITILQNGTNITCEFDWRITEWVASSGVNDYQLYVFLDSTPGDPEIGNEIWSSGTQGGITSWSGVQSINCSPAAPLAGIYYYKLAVWLVALNSNTGPITAGYDNAQARFGSALYVSSGSFVSSAFDMGNSSPVQIIEWDEITPACSPVCEARFQIQTAPDVGGSPGVWSFTWSGPDGEDGDETDYYTVSAGQLIHTDHNGDQWMRYKTTLAGDGSDTPIVKEVRINYQ